MLGTTVIGPRCFRRLVWLAALPLLAVPIAATAAPSEVEAVGRCPGQEAVAAALAPALGRERARPAAAIPRVVDLGDRFEVTAAGQRGQYDDPARDCRERARIAAVFIALALNPPELQAPPPEPVVPPAPATVQVPLPSPEAPGDEPPAPIWLAAGAAARIDAASTGDDPAQSVFMGGGEVRGVVGRRGWGLVATAGVLAPATTRFGTIPVRQQRFPFSLGVTAISAAPWGFQVAGDAAIVVAPFTLRAEGLQSATAALRADVGARLALALRSPRVAKRGIFFVELHAEAFPRPYHLEVGPIGAVGTTSKLWIGAAVGAWFGGP